MAQRDMTEREFLAALKRNGFTSDKGFMSALGLRYFKDATGAVPNTFFPGVYQQRPFKFLRRITLASLIKSRQRDVERAKQEKAARDAKAAKAHMTAAQNLFAALAGDAA